jgi:hypothetical protein
MRMKRVIYLLFANFLIINLSAQQQTSSARALSLFNEGRYAEALVLYEQLANSNSRDVNYNYYYGLSLLKLNIKSDEAIKRLKVAATRPPSPDVHYYLGYLYQRAYEPQLASEHYQRFLKTQKADKELSKLAERALRDCQSAESLINKHFSIEIIAKDTINATELLSHYGLSKEAGQLLKAGDFFKVGVSPDQIVFRTERANEVFFPLLGSTGKYDLYKIVRLLDAWTDAELLAGEINSDYNELYPFLLTDGTTIYFSSDRPGGMGGLDIYQSYFDPSSGSFSEPDNLGPPFNSPDDDYLLVPDIYAGKAWFTTNRGAEPGKAIVVELIWDNKVVRNLSQDINQVKVAASLPISPNAMPKASTTLHARAGVPASKDSDEFRFMVNDTLVYTRFDQFQSKQALGEFRSAYCISHERDSLTSLLSNKRRAYSQSYDQDELKRLIDSIVELEKETYGLDEHINSYYNKARQLERDYIIQLKRNGLYQPGAVSTQSIKQEPGLLEKTLRGLDKGSLTFYSDEEFLKKKELRDKLYRSFFDNSQIAELQMADSLTVWANILSLESARLLEESRKVTSEQLSLKERLSKGTNIEEEMSLEMEALVQQSRDYKRSSLALYEQALDHKYRHYYNKAVAIGATSNQSGSENLSSHARTRYHEADQSIKQLNLYNPEQLERLLALKKNSVDMLEESLEIQLAGAKAPAAASAAAGGSSGTRFIDLSSGSTPSYPAIHKASPAEVSTPSPASVVSAAFVPSSSKPEYKIQIGVFRNNPNAAALAKIPSVSSTQVEGSDTRKYFSGSWSKYETARENVESIREAGFPGAFVVAFINGEQVAIEEARKLE